VNKRLRLAITLGLLAWVGYRTDWAKVGQALASMRVELWLAALGVLVLTQVVSAWRWQILARPFGFERSVGQLLNYYFIGMYFNLLLPTSVGGDVVRAWYLDGGAGRRALAFASVFVDRFSGLLVLLCFGCIGVWVSPAGLPAWIPTLVWVTTASAVLGIALASWLARRGERLTAQLSKVRLAIGALASPRVFAGSTFLSLGVQAGNIVLVWLVGLALGAEVPFGYYWVVVPMVTLLTMLPVSVNGMGVRENAMVVFLAPLGVPETTATPLALLWFLVFLTVSLAGGLVYLFGRFERPVAMAPTGCPQEINDEPVSDRADQGRARQYRAAA
jgi:glycosyltransferase 2 family protein